MRSHDAMYIVMHDACSAVHCCVKHLDLPLWRHSARYSKCIGITMLVLLQVNICNAMYVEMQLVLLCCPARHTIGSFAIAFAPFPAALDWVGLWSVHSRGLGEGAGGLGYVHRDVLEWVMRCGGVAAAGAHHIRPQNATKDLVHGALNVLFFPALARGLCMQTTMIMTFMIIDCGYDDNNNDSAFQHMLGACDASLCLDRQLMSACNAADQSKGTASI